MIECKVLLEHNGEPVQGAPLVYVAVPAAGAFIRCADGRKYRVARVEYGELAQPFPIPQVLLDRLPNIIGAVSEAKDLDHASEAAIKQSLSQLGDAIARRSRPFVPDCSVYVLQATPAPGAADASE